MAKSRVMVSIQNHLAQSHATISDNPRNSSILASVKEQSGQGYFKIVAIECPIKSDSAIDLNFSKIPIEGANDRSNKFLPVTGLLQCPLVLSIR